MASNNSTDAWDRPVPSTSTRRPATPIKDDWEDDDDEDEEPSENQQIWEHANTKTQHPMPALILTKSPSTLLPPQAAFTQQPSMRILKRPSASNSQSSSTSLSGSQPETLKEREARYHAARERIFGGGDTPPPQSPSPSSSSAGKANPQTQSVVKVVREPRGPASGKQSTSSKGFGERT